MVALQSRLITELNHLFIIMNDMNSDDNLSKEDVNHAISPMRHCQTVTGKQSMGVDLGPDAPTPGHPKSRVIVTLRNLKVCMYLLIQLMTKMCSFSILKLVRLKVDLSLLLVK